MNLPPQTEKQTGKRIVSKREYALLIVRNVLMEMGSASLACIIPFCIPIAIFIFIFGVMYDLEVYNMSVTGVYVSLAVAALFGYVGYVFMPTAKTQMENAIKENNNAVPLTRANTADLPAADSLVRASAEPVQEQRTVLLRAATESAERHEEELLRAVVRHQE